MPNHFLAAGVYGCVYYPGYTCKGEPMKRKQWVSKLTYDNSITRNEIEVGQRLQDLPGFIIVERKCPIAYEALTKLKKGCELVTKKKKYILLYSKYVESKELYAYFKEDPLFVRVFRCYYQICELISVLIEHNVVHHDLHFANILYSTDNSNLLLIDFGLSFLADKMVSREYLKFVFNVYMPKWSW
jgi:serine/threonine protein kinase